MKKIVVFLFLILLLLPLVYSLTASIGNAKAILRINASPEEPAIIERTILVNNRNDIPVKITLTPTKEFEKFVNIIDKEFVLQPDESKNAEFILTIDRGGTIKGNINVRFSPADPTIKENSVGLSSSMIIISEGPIIEEPEEDLEIAVKDDTDEENNAGEEDNVDEGDNVQINPNQNIEKPVNKDEHTKQESTEVKEDRANPLIGISIIIAIIIIGLGLFFGLKFIIQK